jgi:hypothetical protein
MGGYYEFFGGKVSIEIGHFRGVKVHVFWGVFGEFPNDSLSKCPEKNSDFFRALFSLFTLRAVAGQ